MAAMLEWVIVVEFDPLVRALLSEWLEEIGVRVLAFGTLDQLPAIGVQLIIVDLVLVEQHRDQVIRQLRTLYPGVPLLGLSTQIREEMDAVCDVARQLGVHKLLPKPCERQALVGAVLSLLGRS